MSEIRVEHKSHPMLIGVELGDILRGAFGATFKVTRIDEDGYVWAAQL